MVGLLIQYAYAQGYELTFGDAWAKTGHRSGSFHYKRLAIDFNLFKNGRYLRTTEAHAVLGEFWLELGGSWGGNFKDSEGNPTPDGNHYSLGEGRPVKVTVALANLMF
jgi:hypothetical protein